MFSVVIPAYNSESTIELSIKSVLSQSRIDLIEEIIVIDDGSTDNTSEKVRSFKEEIETGFIRYIRQNNAGASTARNRGIRLAKAEWIALLDADDIWLDNKIERQFSVLDDNPNIFFLGSHYPLKVLFKERHGLVKLSAKDLCIRSMPYTPSVVFKKEVGMELGLFNEKEKYCEDAEFFQQFLLKDSYYVLAEKLVEIDVGKTYFAETGLSSNFVKMFEGKKRTMRALYKYGLISGGFLFVMCLFCDVKLARRELIRFFSEFWQRVGM